MIVVINQGLNLLKAEGYMKFSSSLHSKKKIINGKECVVFYALIEVHKQLLSNTVMGDELPGYSYSSDISDFLMRDLLYWETDQATENGDLYVYAIFYKDGKKDVQKINIGRDLSKVTRMFSELQAEFENEVSEHFRMLLTDYL